MSVSSRTRAVGCATMLLICSAVASVVVYNFLTYPFSKNKVTLASPWYEDLSVPMLSFVAEHGSLPDSVEGLQSLVSRPPTWEENRPWNGPYLDDPDVISEGGLMLGYELDASGNSFYIYRSDRSREDRAIVRGELLDAHTLSLRGCWGRTIQTYRPSSELLFLSTFENKLQPALERFFEDFGRYPCFHEWGDNILLRESSDVLCEDPLCHAPPFADPDRWNGPYLLGVDGPAIVRGPFEQRLRYYDVADGSGFQIFADGPAGLSTGWEGDFNIVRLSPRSNDSCATGFAQ